MKRPSNGRTERRRDKTTDQFCLYAAEATKSLISHSDLRRRNKPFALTVARWKERKKKEERERLRERERKRERKKERKKRMKKKEKIRCRRRSDELVRG